MNKIHLLFLWLILLFSSDFSLGQNVVDNSFYFYTFYNEDNGGIDGYVEHISEIDSNKIFSQSNLYPYRIDDNRIYYQFKDSEYLFYDYSLQINDTLILNVPYETKAILVVDSIKDLILEDGKSYKHWFLSSNIHSHPIIWVEGLGEQLYGWIPYHKFHTTSTELQAICKEGQLIYWRSKNSMLNRNFNITDSCDFQNIIEYFKISVHHFSPEKLRI